MNAQKGFHLLLFFGLLAGGLWGCSKSLTSSAHGSVAKSSVISKEDAIKSDMTLNEAPLLNAPLNAGWPKRAMIGMGNAPRGDATPTWWTPANPSLKDSTPWTTIAMWFVIYPGTGNAAKNIRVKVYDLKMYLLNKTENQWIKIDIGTGKPQWAGNYDFNLITPLGTASFRTEVDGALSYKFNDALNPIHGGALKIDLAKYFSNFTEIGGLLLSAKTQLVVDSLSGPDDRDQAQILFSVGADYYPSMTTVMSDFSPMKYTPCVGGSRFGLVNGNPRTHYMATIDSLDATKPSSVFVAGGGRVTTPPEQLMANLPPDL